MSADGRSLTIMHVIDSGGFYGAERVILDLAAETQAMGHRVIISPIIAPEDDEDVLGANAERAGIGVMRFTLPDGFHPAAFANVFAMAQAERVDVLHSHGYKSNIMCALARRSTRFCPVIATLHGWTSQQLISRAGVYEIAEKLLAHRLDHVACVSESVRAAVSAFVRADRLSSIPNGISLTSPKDDMDFDPGLLAFISGQPTLLAAGRLSAEKGFSVLIEAMAQVVQSCSRVRLVIAGEGPLRHQLASQVTAFKLADHVVMPGYLKDLRALMRRCRAFVLSSQREGLPIVLLEAMAERVPIIATRVGAVPNVLQEGDCGTLIDPDDSGSLAAAILTSMGNQEESARRVEAAHRRLVEEFSCSAMATRYTQAYQNLMALHAPGLGAA